MGSLGLVSNGANQGVSPNTDWGWLGLIGDGQPGGRGEIEGRDRDCGRLANSGEGLWEVPIRTIRASHWGKGLREGGCGSALTSRGQLLH